MELERYGFTSIQLEDSELGVREGFRYEKEALVAMEIPETIGEEWAELLLENRETLVEKQMRLDQRLNCDFLLLVWREQEEERLLFFSNTRRVRALEFLDYLIPEFGLVKGDASAASGCISSAILKVQMADADVMKPMEYFLRMSQSYFVDCDWIDAGEFSIHYKAEIEEMKQYGKRPIPWAYVKSTDITPAGQLFSLKSLENESGLTITASSETYIMIGCRGEIYDITRKKFENTYEATEQALDVFEMMLDFLPAVETIPEGEYVSLDEIAHLCYPKKGKGIYAQELQKRTKVFPVNQNQEYFLGRPGDYLAVRVEDLSDVYIIQREIFQQTYE